CIHLNLMIFTKIIRGFIRVWPESKELLPKEADKASTALPALRVEDLNKMIGLPSEAA
ncbi:Nmad5 family putative nucleotide modification protein, partial [Escherichia coli]|uniref:Nmad5 family putative nucleotide modification protein n=1 Tax=Escherichia coli TaxID=562 RepID=UPI001FCDBDAE